MAAGHGTREPSWLPDLESESLGSMGTVKYTVTLWLRPDTETTVYGIWGPHRRHLHPITIHNLAASMGRYQPYGYPVDEGVRPRTGHGEGPYGPERPYMVWKSWCIF
jgi:hypothetical protein